MLKLKSLITFSMLLSFVLTTQAQQKKHRCATDECFQKQLQTDPILKADWGLKNKNLDAYFDKHPIYNTEALDPANPITIPVVVHIVLPDPSIITDEDVEYFIKGLNRDFSGLNADSVNIGGHDPNLRGHCGFRFAMARRDASGKATTGIERRSHATTIFGTTNPQPIKTAANGIVPWDVTKYYNLWVGRNNSQLLGIAPNIGPGTQTGNNIDGVIVDYTCFASNPCYSAVEYNMARTSVHEIGHNLGLFHTFTGGCASKDFSTQLTSTGKALPASMLTLSNDDTPPTSAPTYGSPAVGTMNTCTPSVELMFQNYMDYTDDAAMTMFTVNQVKRMEYVIETFRPGWLTTKGHLPPDGTPENEVGIVELTRPGGSEYIQATCKTITYPNPAITCHNPTISPRVKISNYGIAPLTSVTINTMVNGVVKGSKTYTINLPVTKVTYLDAPAATIGNGTNVVKIFTSMPNGVMDSVRNNDTLSRTITIASTAPAITPLPQTEDFEGAAFNPTSNGWVVLNNPSTSATWLRNTSAFKNGAASASMRMFNYSTSVGHLDYLRSPLMYLMGNTDSLFISFDYAYRARSNSASHKRDTLYVDIAYECDTTNWTSLWSRGGDQLRTSATLTNATWTAAAADWATTPAKIFIPNSYINTPFYLALKTKNGAGQNLYIDNISLFRGGTLPLKLGSFSVVQNSNNITCKWETKQEINVKNFNVERSVDGRTFNSFGTVEAIGNSNATSFYQFTDEKAYSLKASVLYYRLKMNDVDGKFTYSNIINVKVGEKQQIAIYPNPTRNTVNVQITNSNTNNELSKIQVVDYLGRTVLEKQITLVNGTQTFELNTSNLQSGNYVVVFKTNNQVKTLKLVKE